MNATLAFALRLACLPLLLGVLVLGLWWLTDWYVLTWIGVLVLPFGVVMTVIVAMLIAKDVRQARRDAIASGKYWLQAGFVATVMLGNYPAAIGVIVLASWLGQRCTLLLVNEAESPWREVIVSGPGSEESFGTLPGTASARRTVWFRGEGVLEIRWNGQQGEQQQVISGYWEGVVGGGASVVRRPDGSLHVSSWHRW